MNDEKRSNLANEIYPNPEKKDELHQQQTEAELEFKKSRILENHKNKVISDDEALALSSLAMIFIGIAVPYFSDLPVLGVFARMIGVLSVVFVAFAFSFAIKSLRSTKKIQKIVKIETWAPVLSTFCLIISGIWLASFFFNFLMVGLSFIKMLK